MGDYTGLRFRGVVKEGYRRPFEWALNNNSNECRVWEHMANIYDEENYPIWREWAEYSRSSFIPYGAICYIPWKEDHPEWQRSFNAETGEWVFQCSLKNYSSTIGKFWTEVVPELMERVDHFETWFEYDDESTVRTYPPQEEPATTVVVNQFGNLKDVKVVWIDE